MGPKQKKAIQFKIKLGNKTEKLLGMDPKSEEYKRLKTEIEKDEKTLNELQKVATDEWFAEKGYK